MINQFFVRFKDSSWYAWTVADITVASVFSIVFYKSLRYFYYRHQETSVDHIDVENRPHLITDALPYGYLMWLIYSIILAVKIVIIFL